VGNFNLRAEFDPKGDQPKAIEDSVRAFERDGRQVVLLGATGTGKTLTAAHIIARLGRPTLVISHNKTLAAQLCGEFKEFFPENAVEYFVSYYDYYQPEAYIPSSDTYIEKDTMLNEEIDKLRHSATAALFERRDVIVVASVSCIYGLGSPEDYGSMVLSLRPKMVRDRNEVLRRLVEIQYERNDVNFTRGTFRVRGDTIEILPAYFDAMAIRVEFFGDEIERVSECDPLTGKVVADLDHVFIYPASHFVTVKEKLQRAVGTIAVELEERLRELRERDRLVEAQRLEQRVRYDLEMIQEVGYCPGVENYSRHLTGRAAGEPPYTLLDFFPPDPLIIIDESHQTIPQIRAMFAGDRSRKETLVEYGFRLPSALDNRPLTFDEFQTRAKTVLYASATPAQYELERADAIVEQIVRPTGLLDPKIEVRPTKNQVDDLIAEAGKSIAAGERVLVTTMTKKMAEDLSDYLREIGLRTRYLHSEVDTLERMAILRDLRLGVFDVLVGINLLREGLDLPEVSLVAILDADKAGYLRSATALIQTMGRAARNVNGRVVMYADTMTGSMRQAIDETDRRREIQAAFNETHGITPETVKKAVRDLLATSHPVVTKATELPANLRALSPKQLQTWLVRIQKDMTRAARDLEFERAAGLRDVLFELRAAMAAKK
jgi:excinuclease ABC subunit B